MKKIFFICSLFAAAISSQAYDEVGVVPVSVNANTAVEVFFTLNNTSMADKMKTITLNVEWPAGWTVSSSPTLNHDRVYDWDEDFEEWGTTSNFTIAVSKPETGITRYFAYSTNNHSANGSEGWLFSVKVKAPAGTPAGYYPVKVKAGSYVTMSANDSENIIYDDMISYIKIGDPTGEQSLAFSGVVPSFVNDALAKETALTSLDLSAVTAVNGDFTYVDGRAVAGTSATADVKYVGNKANYYSVNVPFTGTATGEFYELKSVDENFAVFSTATTVKAGETYLAKGEVTLTANAAVATIENKENQTGSYVLDGKFYTGKNLTVPATRGLFKEVPAGSNLRVVIDGELTGITTAEIDAQAGNTYDLQGRQSVNAKNGVFVVNGKKQFVK